MGTKVRKALTPEEKTLIDNIKSMVEELEGIEQAEGPESGAMEEQASMKADVIDQMSVQPPNMAQANPKKVKPEDESDEETEKCLKKSAPVKKGIDSQGSSEGSTASDDAEERIEDDIPEGDQKDIAEVSKMLALLMSRKGVRKADPTMDALTKLAEEQKVMKQALENLIRGLGVAEQITAAVEEERVEKSERTPVVSTDRDEVVRSVAKALVEALGVNKTEDASHDINTVRKSLAGVLPALFGK